MSEHTPAQTPGPSGETLGRALGAQAGRVGPAGLTLADVRGRARSLRRRRAAVGATGAAALVAAALVPLALLVGGDRSAGTLPPAGTPTVSDTANPVEEEAYPPGWVVDGEVRSSDGTAFTPDVDGTISYLLRLGPDRWVLGVEPEGNGLRVVVVDPTGSVLATYDALEGGLATNDVGTAVAWVGPDLRPRSLVAGADGPLRWDGRLVSNQVPPSPAHVLPGCDEQACEMVVELSDVSPGEENTLVTVGSDGGVRPFDLPGVLRVFDVSADASLASGFTSIDEERAEACSAVVETATGERLWESCGAARFRFSPDETMVLATDAFPEGLGQSFVRVLSAGTGELLGSYEGGTVFDYRWESDDAFLVSVQLEDGQHQLVRVGAATGEQTVVERVDGVPDDPSGMVRLGG